MTAYSSVPSHAAMARPASGLIQPWVMRAMVANDEALLEHYMSWADGMMEGDLVPHNLHVRVAQVVARLPLRRGALAQLTCPAESCLANAAPSGGAVQPASTLHHP